ncbi:MAG: nucleotidyltransferase domain-containing protein [Fibrobacter sp.]|nr:nucleotidyltransferase domain-containing protein [Fibrobacter sp.]
MKLNLEEWLKSYVQTVQTIFASRILFIGIQGSYGRKEASATSDIDVVLILDKVTAKDLKAYDNAISKLSHRDKICGFISGKNEIFNWNKADLFQFYHDTTPLWGNLRSLIPHISKNDVRSAILTGACNIYHMCVHNLVHEKDPAILTSLYKASVFVVQAIFFLQTGIYIKKHHDLMAAVSQNEQLILKAYLNIKEGKSNHNVDFDSLSESLLVWSGQLIVEYGDEK